MPSVVLSRFFYTRMYNLELILKHRVTCILCEEGETLFRNELVAYLKFQHTDKTRISLVKNNNLENRVAPLFSGEMPYLKLRARLNPFSAFKIC